MRLSLPQFVRRLRPERPQLAALVALLLVSFALTLGLAWQAWDAGQGEEAVSETLVDIAAESAARQWREAVDASLYGSIRTTFDKLHYLLARTPGAVDAVMVDTLLVRDALPPGAVVPNGVRFFARELGGGGETAEDSLLADWLLQREPSQLATVGNSELVLGIAADHPVPGRRGAFAYLAHVDGEGRISHVAGYWLEERFLKDALGGVLGTLIEQHSAEAERADFGNVYAFSARRQSDGQNLVGDGARVVGQEVIDGPSAVLHGISLGAGITAEGLAGIHPRGFGPRRLPALLALLFSIAVVIGSAVLVLRREAELNWMRARFVSGVSHELRTPLAQIRMFAETLMLGRVRSEADRRRSLEIIDQEARRLSHLVENILMFSRVERGAVRITTEKTRISAELAAMVQDFRALPKAQPSEFRLELQENVVVPVDVDALRQIVNNLLDNAVKYGPEEQRVTVGLAMFDGSARLWVDDEGPGIPAVDRQNVFQSFYRLRRDEASRVAGSGIGLAVVRELAALHRGEAWAEEAPGGGARLVVAFPEAELAAASAAAAAVA